MAEDPRRAILRFYTTVIRDEDRHITALCQHPALGGLTFKRFSLDSFALFVTCKNQSAVSDLESLNRTHRLGDIMTEVLASKEVMVEVGVRDLRIEATLNRAEVEAYRKMLKGGDIAGSHRSSRYDKTICGNEWLTFHLCHFFPLDRCRL